MTGEKEKKIDILIFPHEDFIFFGSYVINVNKNRRIKIIFPKRKSEARKPLLIILLF